jgi:hypothetical protein
METIMYVALGLLLSRIFVDRKKQVTLAQQAKKIQDAESIKQAIKSDSCHVNCWAYKPADSKEERGMFVKTSKHVVPSALILAGDCKKESGELLYSVVGAVVVPTGKSNKATAPQLAVYVNEETFKKLREIQSGLGIKYTVI